MMMMIDDDDIIYEFPDFIEFADFNSATPPIFKRNFNLRGRGPPVKLSILFNGRKNKLKFKVINSINNFTSLPGLRIRSLKRFQDSDKIKVSDG
jgi:hypothetical protein